MFQRSLYHYELPESLIAAEALAERDRSRLLVLRGPGEPPEHRHIYDLPELLDPDTLVVVNNTRVFAARLKGERPQTGGKIEFFLLRQVEPCTWEGLMKSSARIDRGFSFVVRSHSDPSRAPVPAEVLSRRETNAGTIFTARFETDPVQAELGETPLPPYISAVRLGTKSRLLTTSVSEAAELREYNTVYARETGSVAAPTAGRHFTPELITKLRERGIEWAEVTLHVGLGTFKPVAVDDIREHLMHPEQATITPEVAERINRARAAGKKILAVGTTSVRTLEGFWDDSVGALAHGTREVNLFIYPGSGHRWRVVDQLLTNFHLPESTLLMMICDFAGDRERVLRAYEDAVREKYRFYSYGDAMLMLQRQGVAGEKS
jgi:S-adenosylmethionine:tRNA ribosyltransferase-isomerase